MMTERSAAVITVTGAENPQSSVIAVSMALASLPTLGRRHSNSTLPLFNSVRTFANPRSTNKRRKSAIDTRLVRPTLMPRISAMQPLTGSGATQRHHRNAKFAIENSGGGIEARALGIVFEHRTAIELQTAGRQPIAQHGSPRFLDLDHRPLEAHCGVLPAGNRRLLRVAEHGQGRRRFASRIVSALSGCHHIRVIMADAIAWLPKQAARGHPGIDRLLPKRADGFTV